jgi:catechol 2,3-dioxygenase-like lactoylglutathione lyase family enzyme
MKKLTEIAFFTDKVAEMAAFYENFLGAAPVAASEDLSIFMVGETKIFIHKTYTPKEGELPPENHFAYTVADVEAACADLKEQGYNIEVEGKNYYWGYSAYLRDPDGHLLELIQESEGQ